MYESPDDGVEVHEPPRLGELRERPRGRERPVRAELPLRRRADQRGPAHLLPLHGPHPRPPGGPRRHLHAEALRQPDRQRPAPALEPVGRGDRRRAVRRRRTTRAGSACREIAYHYIGGLIDHARGAGGGHVPDRQLLQAHGRRRAGLRRHLGAGLRHLRRQQPNPDAACARRRPGRRTGPATARPTRTSPWRPSWRPGSTASTAASTRASRTVDNLYTSPGRPWPRGASGPCRRPCCTPSTSSWKTTCCGTALGKTPDGDYVDYYAKVKRDEFLAWHAEVSELGGASATSRSSDRSATGGRSVERGRFTTSGQCFL